MIRILLVALACVSASAQFLPFPGPVNSVSSSTCGTPSFSPGAGTYTGTQSVTITSAGGSGCTVCYNTTGSPSATVPGTCDGGSTTYTIPVSVSISQTLYAIGTQLLYTNSSVASAAYTIAVSPSGSGFITSSCSSPAATCTASSFPETGNAIWLAFNWCDNSACTAPCTGTPSVSDGTNSFSLITSESTPTTIVCTAIFVASNISTGTRNITASTNSGNKYYNGLYIYCFSGSAVSPIDSAVTATGNGTSANPSITSTGNVGYSGEITLGFLVTAVATTISSPYTAILSSSDTHTRLAYNNPAAGSTTTMSSTAASTVWSLSLIGIHP